MNTLIDEKRLLQLIRNLHILTGMRVPHGSGVGQHVPDVADAGEVHDHPLKAQAKACVFASEIL